MSSIKNIYLDYNATTPVDERVLEAMTPFFTQHFGNASSKNHKWGWKAEEAVEEAREQVASLIGAKPKEITFTSGATEANNLIIKSLSGKSGNVITTPTEHHAVIDPLVSIENEDLEVKKIPVNQTGEIDVEEFKKYIIQSTLMVSIIHGNNETGVILPIEEIAKISSANEVPIMTDATQTVGKIPVDVKALDVDFMTFSSHKLYGPKGVGALYVNSNSKLKLDSLIEGGGQEKGLRSGTLNTAGIVGFGKACELCQKQMANDTQRISTLRNQLEQGLLKIADTEINGSKERRLPNVTNILFKGIQGEKLLLSMPELGLSLGSACSSATFEPSHVIKALGRADAEAFGSVRFSLGRFTTQEEIEFTIKRVTEAVETQRMQ